MYSPARVRAESATSAAVLRKAIVVAKRQVSERKVYREDMKEGRRKLASRARRGVLV